jgi:hypothetical protein
MALDIVKAADRYAASFYPFYVNSKGWRKFDSPHDLPWTKLRFSPDNAPHIPAVRGIYAFTIEHTPSKFPSHAFIYYVGQSGNTGKGHLKQRYRKYLQEQKSGTGRHHIHYMMKNWKKDLFFSFCALPDTAINLRDLETRLLGALSPPANVIDFPADISAARRARFS